jgi:inhibitor of cysteine peptidase
MIAQGVQFSRVGRMLLILGLALALSAFVQSPGQGPPEQIVVTAADDGGQIELAEGQVLVVKLLSNPSTGYGWQVVQPTLGPILRQADVVEFQPHEDLLGTPGTEILSFEGLSTGEATLTLEYRRPWESGVEPAETFHLQVRALGTFEGAPLSQAPSPTSETLASGEAPAPTELPPAFNWCERGGCTPVKDQGQCGSCWAFATVGPLELNVLVQEGGATDLSEQYLVSCNTEGWGCNGGGFAHDYHAWKVPPGEEGAGAVAEASFPYLAEDTPCAPPHAHLYQMESWQYVGNQWSVPPIVDIKRAIYEHGPVAVAVCVNPAFQSYSGGVFEGPGCSVVNHAVVLVGWDDSQGESGAWLLRNSWGAEWGEGGYMRIAYGVSNVGLGANYVLYAPSPCYSLATDVSPDLAGSITLDPPPNCAGVQYQPGTTVHLTAVSSPSWRFANWSGAVSGDLPSATVEVNSHKSVTAHFKPDLCTPWLLLPPGLAGCWAYEWRRSHPASSSSLET